MGKLIFRLCFAVMICVISLSSFAQDKNDTGLNGVMRSNNKIYVVMAVCVTILVGLILYLISIDRKMGKREGL